MADDSRTSANEQPRPLWTRILLPSVGDLIFVAILGTLLCTSLSVRLLNDGGIGWHIRAGQIIAATGKVPRVDSFSSTMSGHTWFAWEWLYDLAAGKLERVAGLNGVVWLTAAVIAAVFSCTFRLLVQRGVGLGVALILVLVAASTSMIHFLTRPHVVSWLFTLVFFWILDRTELDALSESDSAVSSGRWLWLLPPLMLLWVNVHGGFLVGLVLLGIYGLGAIHTSITMPEARWDQALMKLRALRRSKQLLLITLLSLAATFCNPYGWRLHAHIYEYLSSRFLIDHIDEFQSPNFHGWAERCFASLMLMALIALAVKVRRVRLSEGLVVLFAIYSGLYAVRNVPVSSLLLVVVAGPMLGEAIARFQSRIDGGDQGLFQRMLRIELSLKGHLWPSVATVAALCVALNGGKVGSGQLMDAHFGSPRFPVEAVHRLEQSQSWGPILAPDFWGGYLIYELYPRTRVVIDDRHDLYGEENLRDYVTMIHGGREWEKFLRDRQVCCVLAAKGSTFANVLQQSQDWRAIYRDDVAVAFQKTSRMTTYGDVNP